MTTIKQASDHEDQGLSPTADHANPNGEREVGDKPAKRNWYSPHFWDFKFSTVAQTIFAFALFGVGVAQVCVYLKQANIMTRQLRDIEAQQRAYLEVINPEMIPYDANGKWLKKGDPGVAGWFVSPGWKNVGLTLAQHVRFGFDLEPYPENGPQSDDQLIKSCPTGPPLHDHPEFAGSTVAPGESNGIIAVSKKLPFAVATAAQQNQTLILFVIDAEYQDAFESSPVRHSYACVDIVVNDAEKSAFSFPHLKREGD